MRRTGLMAALATAMLASCHLAAGLGDLELVDDATGGSGTGGDPSAGGDGGTGTGEGGMGGSGSCAPQDCPGVDSDCRVRICDAMGMCSFENAAMGEDCDDGGELGRVCDGEGMCVECNGEEECESPAICEDHACVPPLCNNGKNDPSNGETGIDCGGSNCNPCPNGSECSEASDCVSGVCGGGDCAPCDGADPFLCSEGSFCNSFAVCEPIKSLGATCSEDDVCGDCNVDAQCGDGACVEGVCCNEPCTQGCQSCLGANTGGTNGTCANVANGTDPKDACTASCSGNVSVGDNCFMGSCLTTSCSPYICSGDSCLTTCTDQTQCLAGNYCQLSSFTCVPKSANGSTCGGPVECQSGNCVDSFCCDTPCTEACYSCNLAVPGPGTCTPDPAGNDPENDCAAPATCNGNGSCT